MARVAKSSLGRHALPRSSPSHNRWTRRLHQLKHLPETHLLLLLFALLFAAILLFFFLAATAS